jgi:hypothetical protein
MVWGSNSGEGEIFHAVETRSMAHLSSFTIGTGSFMGVKQPERGADHPHPSSASCKWVGAVPLPPFCAYVGMSWGDLYLCFHD